LTRPPASR